MNKYIILNVIMLVNVSSLFGKDSFMKNTQEAAQNFVYNSVHKKTTHAFLLSYPLRFVNGKSGATRYVKYVNFYSTKPQGKLDLDTLIDLVVFPVVDNAVGRIMTPLKGILYVRGATQRVSPHATNFLVDNAQLVTSAAITRAISIGAGKGFKSAGQKDLKQFGTACFIQVSCDAVDEAVIKPLVHMTVGDDGSWIGWAAHAGLNMAFFNVFTSIVKNKTE